MSRNLFWLSDEQWKRIEPFLPTDVRGVERADDRRVISGIVHVLKSGCRWCDCPEAYGPPTTIYNRFVRWARHMGKSVRCACRARESGGHADDRLHAY
ncbi:MAG: transposase [Methylocella sp.]